MPVPGQAAETRTPERPPAGDLAIDDQLRSALAHHRRGELGAAETIYRQVLERHGDNPEALHLLGVLAHQVGRCGAAVGLLRRAIAERPNQPEYYSDLGNVLAHDGDSAAAEAAYDRALELDPESAVSWCNLGSLQKSRGELEKAEFALRRAVSLQPDLVEALSNLAGVLVDQGNATEAVIQCRRAALLDAANPSVYANLAAALKEEDAFDEAVLAAETAISLAPGLVEAHIVLAALRLDQGRLADAATASERALALSPDHPEALYNLGNAKFYLGDEDVAMTLLSRAIARKPEFAEAHLSLGRIHLKRRELQGFWSVYARRWESRNYKSFRRKFPQPRWRGEPLGDRSILIWGEQGIGDELFFAGLIPEIAAAADRCLVETEPRLTDLLARSFPNAEIVPRTEPPHPATHAARFDFEAPMGDLGQWCRPEFEGFNSLGSYLTADPEMTQLRRRKYQALGAGPRIGISWASRPPKHIDLSQWRPIFDPCLSGYHPHPLYVVCTHFPE